MSNASSMDAACDSAKRNAASDCGERARLSSVEELWQVLWHALDAIDRGALLA